MWEQDRINAMISYFFLGPLFLLAKKGTPLAETYVRWHAKKASTIITIMLIVYGFYFLFLKVFAVSIIIPGGISLHTILVIAILGMSILLLISWAYKAYHGGVEADRISLPDFQMSSHAEMVENEEDRIRILASVIPLLGMYMTSRYEHPLMVRARILWSSALSLFLFSLFFSTSTSIIPFLITVVSILIFVIEGVYLFVYGRWLSLDLLAKIPSYARIESYIIASMRMCWQFVGVVFWKEKKYGYSELLAEEINSQKAILPKESYFMPAWLIGLPFWNILCIPSLFIEKYREYRTLIIEWLIITLIYIYIIFVLGQYNHPILLLLLFPIIHIALYASRDLSTSVPWIGIFTRISRFGKWSLSSLEEKQKEIQKESYTYDVSPR